MIKLDCDGFRCFIDKMGWVIDYFNEEALDSIQRLTISDIDFNFVSA